MKISVRVHPKSKLPRVTVDEAGILNIYVSAQATDGKANDATIKALAEYYAVPKTQIRLLKGHTTTLKLFEIFTGQ